LIVNKHVFWSSLAATVALSLPLGAQAPVRPASNSAKAAADSASAAAGVRSANQALADAVAQRLHHHPALQQANVTIMAHNGTVTLSGTVAGVSQKEQLLAAVQSVPGVHVVRDALQVTGHVANVSTAHTLQPPVAEKTPMPLVEPAPLGVPGQLTPELQAPPLPPYAWPTYAPYPNMSRVAYPTAYPYNAFPFIGPFYPFPKVPLGWRKVTLEWEDGHWYYGRNSTPHDYWRVRFW
jgi:hypothetical protein